MACSCNKKNAQTWQVTASNGTITPNLTQVQAVSMAARIGGTASKAS